MTINPSGTAPACIGDQLELTCTIMGGLLRWSFYQYSDEGSGYSRLLSTSSEITSLQVNNTQFTFSRVSLPNTLPLVSVLLISPVSSYLNRTVVNCTDRTTDKSSSTIINIITDLGKFCIYTALIQNIQNWQKHRTF